MKKLVFESLDELYESKVKDSKKEDKPKSADISKTKEKAEKSKPTKLNQDKKTKAKQAIDALKKEIINAKKPGAFKTTAQKNAKLKELVDKIKAWEKKLK